MANTFKIQFHGAGRLEKRLREYPDKVKAVTRKVIVQHVTAIHEDQVRNASRFTDRAGILRGLGLPEEVGEIVYRVYCNAPHAAYVEFGTRKKFQPIPGIDASQYRGSSGQRGLYNAILKWVIRKGIAAGGATDGSFSVKTRRRTRNVKKRDAEERKVAYLIYREILINGARPQPFFFAPYLNRRQRIYNDLVKEIKAIR